jgi:hypothetical protein
VQNEHPLGISSIGPHATIATWRVSLDQGNDLAHSDFGSSLATNIMYVEIEGFFDLVQQSQLKAQSVGDQNGVNIFGV